MLKGLDKIRKMTIKSLKPHGILIVPVRNTSVTFKGLLRNGYFRGLRPASVLLVAALPFSFPYFCPRNTSAFRADPGKCRIISIIQRIARARHMNLHATNGFLNLNEFTDSHHIFMCQNHETVLNK